MEFLPSIFMDVVKAPESFVMLAGKVGMRTYFWRFNGFRTGIFLRWAYGVCDSGRYWPWTLLADLSGPFHSSYSGTHLPAAKTHSRNSCGCRWSRRLPMQARE